MQHSSMEIQGTFALLVELQEINIKVDFVAVLVIMNLNQEEENMDATIIMAIILQDIMELVAVVPNVLSLEEEQDAIDKLIEENLIAVV